MYHIFDFSGVHKRVHFNDFFMIRKICGIIGSMIRKEKNKGEVKKQESGNISMDII